MRINSISSFGIQNNFKKSNNIQAFKNTPQKTDSISFTSDFNLNYISRRGEEIAIKAMEVRSHARNVEFEAANQQEQAVWLKDCAIYEFERVATSKDGVIRHAWGEKDVEVLSSELVNDRILPTKIVKYTADGDVNFIAEFEDAKLTRAFVRNFDGTNNIFEYDKNSAKPKLIIIRKTPEGFEEKYVFDLFTDELLNFEKNHKLQDDGKKTTEEIMTFTLDENNKTDLIYYQKDRVQYLGNILETGETYFFDDYMSYSFQEGYKKTKNGEIAQGETIVMNKNKIQEYEQGYKQLEDGTKIHLPKMRTARDGYIIELLDYGYSEKPNGEIVRQNRVEMQGGIYHLILRMFGFIGE